MQYTEVFSRLTYETAGVIFFKKNGDVRIMLCTRNLSTAALEYGFKGSDLGGHDNRCNINNGNIAVIDMLIGEARSFNIDRLVSIDYYGIVETKDQLEEVAAKFAKFREEYMRSSTQIDDISDDFKFCQ